MEAAELAALVLTPTVGGVQLELKVVPGASRTRIAGVLGPALKIAVAAPPEGGKANAAVIKLLAATFSVKRGDVALVSGHTQPHKRVLVKGITAGEARSRLRG